MTALTLEQARDLGAHLALPRGASVVAWDSPTARLVRAGLDLAAAIPGVGSLLDAASLRDPRVSRCVPTPAGALVLLSEGTATDPATYVEAVAHEVTHAGQIARVGAAQGAIDYLGSGELRADREAQAYVVGLFARYLVTGDLPTEADAMARLGGGLYHLDAGELELARGVVASGLATIAAGLSPPYAVALDVLAWLRAHAPEAIVPAEHRP